MELEELRFPDVLFEVKDSVGYITLNDPRNLNPVTVEMTKHLKECITYCEVEPSVRCIVLRGAGGTFSAGGNVKAMKDRLDRGYNPAKASLRIGGEWIMRLRTISKPTIAWIEGAAAGVGLSMAMACDFSIAQEDGKMSFAFVNIGYVPDGGITHMLMRAVGTARATELLMSGKRFTAKEAAEWGIITKAVPKDQLEGEIQKYIKKYSTGPGVAYGQIKRLINSTQFRDLGECMQTEVDAQYVCSCSEDHYNAVTAFVNKEKPVFKGR